MLPGKTKAMKEPWTPPETLPGASGITKQEV
jgi:hypothetical protein